MFSIRGPSPSPPGSVGPRCTARGDDRQEESSAGAEEELTDGERERDAGEHGDDGDDELEVQLVLRRNAPYEPLGDGFEADSHSGSLELSATDVAEVEAFARRVPTVLDVYLDRPAELTPFHDTVAAITADFGVADEALLAVLFGDRAPEGNLPFDLPRSMEAVVASRPDAPFDTRDPLFRFGYGLRYEG